MDYEKYPTFPSNISKCESTAYAPKAYAPKTYHTPVAHTASYHATCPPAHTGNYGAFTSLGVILVLFILLVIVSRSWTI